MAAKWDRFGIEITDAGRSYLNYQVSEHDQGIILDAADKILAWGKTQKGATPATVQVDDAAAEAMTNLCHAYFRTPMKKKGFPGGDVTSIVVRRFALAEEGQSISYHETEIQFEGQRMEGFIHPSNPSFFNEGEGVFPIEQSLPLHDLHLDAERNWFEGKGHPISLIGTFWKGDPFAELGTLYAQPRDVAAVHYPSGRKGDGKSSVYIPTDHVVRAIADTARITRRGQVISGYFHPHKAVSFSAISDELKRTGVTARYFVGCAFKGRGDLRFTQLNTRGRKKQYPHLCSLRPGHRTWKYERM